MLAITIEFLAERYVATAYNDREKAEWPPHPARLFSALVATWAEGEPETTGGEGELAALRWLEQLPAPEILASGSKETSTRVLPVFVPVNDVGVVSEPDREKLDAAEVELAAADTPKARASLEKQVAKLRQKYEEAVAKAVAPPAKFGKGDGTAADKLLDRRTRQPRTFPSAVPAEPVVGFVWAECTVPAPVQVDLARLAERLVRLGHSSTLVRCEVHTSGAQTPLSNTLTPYVPDDTDGDLMIRWVSGGQVDRLRAAFEQHRETEPRVLPARFVRYREGRATAAVARTCSVFSDDLIVFARVAGPRLPVTSVAGLARQFRRALMSHADQPVPEIISGHKPEGAPTDTPHLAVVPLPVVSGPHADGALIGVGLVLPREGADRAAVVRALGRFEQAHARDADADVPTIELVLGEAGVLCLQRVAWGEDSRATLRASTWARPSTHWASATPVALDRHPGALHDADAGRRAAAFASARESVAESVERIGLPSPIEIDVVRSCVLPGTAKPRVYPRFPIDTRRPQRVLVHVRLVFAEPVRGPVLLGAGRYQGLGLCLPLGMDSPGGMK